MFKKMGEDAVFTDVTEQTCLTNTAAVVIRGTKPDDYHSRNLLQCRPPRAGQRLGRRMGGTKGNIIRTERYLNVTFHTAVRPPPPYFILNLLRYHLCERLA